MPRRAKSRRSRGNSRATVPHQQSGTLVAGAGLNVTAAEFAFPVNRPVQVMSGFMELNSTATTSTTSPPVVSVQFFTPTGEEYYQSQPRLIPGGALNRIRFKLPSIGLRHWATANNVCSLFSTTASTSLDWNIVLHVKYGNPRPQTQ
jgi:hypothetical protein